jgi:hypothetical protein
MVVATSSFVEVVLTIFVKNAEQMMILLQMTNVSAVMMVTSWTRTINVCLWTALRILMILLGEVAKSAEPLTAFVINKIVRFVHMVITSLKNKKTGQRKFLVLLELLQLVLSLMIHTRQRVTVILTCVLLEETSKSTILFPRNIPTLTPEIPRTVTEMTRRELCIWPQFLLLITDLVWWTLLSKNSVLTLLNTNSVITAELVSHNKNVNKMNTVPLVTWVTTWTRCTTPVEERLVVFLTSEETQSLVPKQQVLVKSAWFPKLGAHLVTTV